MQERIQDYLDEVGHGERPGAFLFQPVKNNRSGTLGKALSTEAIYYDILMKWAKVAGITTRGCRSTVARDYSNQRR